MWAKLVEKKHFSDNKMTCGAKEKNVQAENRTFYIEPSQSDIPSTIRVWILPTIELNYSTKYEIKWKKDGVGPSLKKYTRSVPCIPNFLKEDIVELKSCLFWFRLCCYDKELLSTENWDAADYYQSYTVDYLIIIKVTYRYMILKIVFVNLSHLQEMFKNLMVDSGTGGTG